MYQFKRQEQSYDSNRLENIVDLTAANSSSFKYKYDFLGTTENQIVANANPNIQIAHRLWRNVRIIVPLKYVSSFFRSLEMPLINIKLNIQLNYTKHSVISSGGGAFKITKTELYVPIVTLDTADNNKSNQLLDSEFKRTVYWNEYKSKIEDVTQPHNNNNNDKRTLLHVAIPGINRFQIICYGF